MCTRNARRRKIRQIVASEVMRKYLRGTSFQWTPEENEARFFASLRHPNELRKLWKTNKSFQKNAGEAITRCLVALETTGVDSDTQELSALWVESFDEDNEFDADSDDSSVANSDIQSTSNNIGNFDPPLEEWVVTLFRSEHTWSGFLQDSEEIMTLAIFNTNCLEFHDTTGLGRRCSQPPGFPVLKTALWINEAIIENNCLKREQQDPKGKFERNAKQSKKGTRLHLGNQGTLEIVQKATEACPLVVEWGQVPSKLSKEVKNIGVRKIFLGKNEEMAHQEYMKGS